MRQTWNRWARAVSVPLLCVLLVTGVFLGLASHGTMSARGSEPQAKHVLLISVDGLHKSDLVWYVNNHPDSTLASLVKKGVECTNAQTPFPSDSFPGMTAAMTGGNPKSTGIYYDDLQPVAVSAGGLR
jgi:predicted AlkP superfamily pyrophosphatase or phosphodiesterase